MHFSKLTRADTELGQNLDGFVFVRLEPPESLFSSTDLIEAGLKNKQHLTHLHRRIQG